MNGISLFSENFTKQLSATSSTLDKISLHSKQLSKEEWQFASFSRNTLTGAYGNLSSSNKSKIETNPSSEFKETNYINSKNERQESNSQTVFNIVNSDTAESSNNKKPMLASDQSTEATTRVTNQEIFTKLQKFLYIFHQEKDEKRFLDLCKHLLYNTETETLMKVKQRHDQQHEFQCIFLCFD